MVGGTELSLALSPLLPPLRFASRVGPARLVDFEPLVARAVEQARAHAPAEKLAALSAAARGFDKANEEKRRAQLAAVVRALGDLLPIPLEISTLATSVSEGAGMLRGMPQSARQPSLFTAPASPRPVEQAPPARRLDPAD